MSLRLLIAEQDRICVQEALDRFYAERPDRYAEGIAQSVYDRYARTVTQYSKPGGRVLDLGSGTWRLPYTLFKQGFDVDGCDVWSETYLAEQIRQMPAIGPRLIRYDGRALPYSDETFDTVCSLAVFEHLLDAEGMLYEIDRVLAAGGKNIILSPNCAGPSGPVRALQSLLTHNDRWWRYETIRDALVGLPRSLSWPVCVQFEKEPTFLYIFPRMRDGCIDFERSDDDAVHLSCPVSYRKWFAQHGYRLLKYNRGEGKTKFACLFNSLFPSWATTVVIVAARGDLYV